jgi:hypothetical protein
MTTIKLLSGGGSGGRKGYTLSSAPSVFDIYWKRVGPVANIDYTKLAMSRDGRYQVVCVNAAGLYYSSDYGVTWVASVGPAATWTEICCSDNGQYFFACSQGGGFYKSTDYGVNFVLAYAGPYVDFRGIACSSTGQYVVATLGPAYPNQLLSINYGVTFNTFAVSSGGFVTHPAVSATGQYMYVCRNGTLLKSVDYGVTWDAGTLIEAGNIDRVRCDGSGARLLFCIQGKALWYSNNFGVNFDKHGWYCVPGGGAVPGGDLAISRDGKYQGLSCAIDGYSTSFLFLSNNYGSIWKAVSPVQGTIGFDFSNDFKYLTRATRSTGYAGGGYLYRKA